MESPGAVLQGFAAFTDLPKGDLHSGGGDRRKRPLYVYTLTHEHICVQVYVYIKTHTYLCVCLYVYTCLCEASLSMCVYIYVYICLYRHTIRTYTVPNATRYEGEDRIRPR